MNVSGPTWGKAGVTGDAGACGGGCGDELSCLIKLICEPCIPFVHPPRGGLSNATEEARQFQFLSFYQKDMVLYMYRSLDRRAADFCPDTELPDVFKVRQHTTFLLLTARLSQHIRNMGVSASHAAKAQSWE